MERRNDGAVARDRYLRYTRALGERPVPAALVDMDLLDRNIDRVVALARAAGKPVRVASKSVRSVGILRYVLARGRGTLAGLMAYSAREALWLVEQGFADILLAYPTAHPADARALAQANARGATVSVVIDCEEPLGVLARAAQDARVTLPVLIDVDMSFRPAGGRVHLGVRRSPIHTADEVVALARAAAKHPGLAVRGLMGYDAQIAGVPDDSPHKRWMNAAKRWMKRRSRPAVSRLWSEASAALRAAGFEPAVVNGGGTGSLAWCRSEPALTEATVGSGFLGGLLFDAYRDFSPEPALLFALQVVRRPAPGMVTCHGGGYVASGEAGPDKLPAPVLPAGLELLPMEGAGEVQTPVRVPADVRLALGSPVFFRHAKAGELAERFERYLLVRDDKVEGTVNTYRGDGQCFL